MEEARQRILALAQGHKHVLRVTELHREKVSHGVARGGLILGLLRLDDVGVWVFCRLPTRSWPRARIGQGFFAERWPRLQWLSKARLAPHGCRRANTAAGER